MRPGELGVALTGLAGLLRAGVKTEQALQAAQLPAVATRVQAGAGLGEALGAAIPDCAHILQDGPTLPDRIERIGALSLRRNGLQRRIDAASAYPMVLALGLLVISATLWWAGEMSFDAFEGTAGMLSQNLILGGGIGVFVLTLWGWFRRRPPIWLRVLPGGKVWAFAGAANDLAFYALLRDPNGGDHDPAAARAQVGDVSPVLAPILAVAEAAPDPSAALHDAVARLDDAAARETRRLVMTLSTGLLLLVALGLAALAWSGLYHPIFMLSGSGL